MNPWKIIPDGGDVDATPDGHYVSTIRGTARIETQDGRFAVPSEPYYARISEDGLFFAGQAGTDEHGAQLPPGVNLGTVMGETLTGSARIDPRIAHGTSGCTFDAAGVLHIIEPAANQTSQGYRYLAEDGTLVLGDATIMSPDAVLSEYSEHYNIRCGQGHDNGGIVIGLPGDYRVLVAGDFRFVRFRLKAGLCSVAAWGIGQGSFIWLFPVDAINSLPSLVVKPDPDPVDPDPIDPVDPKKHMENKSAFVQSHPLVGILGKGDTPRLRAYGSFRFVAAVARDLGPGWGVELKPPVTDVDPVIDDIGYAGDILRYEDEGTDIVNSREDTSASATWGDPGPADMNGPHGFAKPPSDAAILRAMGVNDGNTGGGGGGGGENTGGGGGNTGGGTTDPALGLDVAKVLKLVTEIRLNQKWQGERIKATDEKVKQLSVDVKATRAEAEKVNKNIEAWGPKLLAAFGGKSGLGKLLGGL